MKEMFAHAWLAWCPRMTPMGASQCRAGRVAEAMLGIGVLWSIAGVMLTPSMKFYFQMVALFVYLPSLWLCIARRQELGHLLRARREIWILLALFGWAVFSLLWSGTEKPLGQLKMVSLFMLFILGWVLWARADERRLCLAILSLALVVGLYSLVALMFAPDYGGGRLSGFGGFLDNPNAAAYSIAFVTVMCVPLLPRRGWRQLPWVFLLAASLVYVALCGSRGALLALMVTAIFSLSLVPGRIAKLLPLLLLLGGATLVVVEPGLMARGDAERFELLRSAWPQVQQHVWLGVGLGADYAVTSGKAVYENGVHNFPVHTAIQYGVPALLAFLVLWGMIGYRAWCCRSRALGLSVMLLWVFSSVAMQFDVFSLWERTRAMWLMPWVVILLGLSLERWPQVRPAIMEPN
ncbi:O-antigen ligase family protein [Pseudomonas sp. BGr12]|uniref:O-antigen ligase family protein n=1 Tax=unclassified Pseudomonas TaxID=196821 RepID=UPI001CE0E906|nr:MULTISPECIES: O-antigen ligase family protein [unclassified Pseudomonas]MDL2427133.1 O-antigen ligase family protein [Pseudomonas sp. BJa5]